MGCQGFWGCLLKLLNFLMTVVGLAMVGYGVYLFVMYKQASPDVSPPPISPEETMIQLGRPFIMSVSLSNSILDNLPKAWFIYLFIGVGIVLFVISCFGCIGASTKNGCCLSTVSFQNPVVREKWVELNKQLKACHPCDGVGSVEVFLNFTQYAVFIILLILLELGCAAFIFFNKQWEDKIPTDKTGNFEKIYNFLDDHWSIAKWVLLGIVVLEVSTSLVYQKLFLSWNFILRRGERVPG
ncbi:Tobamovirus multiplication protein 2A, partial [Bienertia sinuspersici]